MENLMNFDLANMIDGTKLLAILGFLAFIVSCITECLKKWEWLDRKVPTGVLVIVLSLVICPASMLGMMAYYGHPVTWYMVFASFIAAFIVALVSMDGWERVTGLSGKMFRK